MKKIRNKIIKIRGNRNRIDLAETFLSNINHEFRTPMNAIMGLCDLLKTRDFDNDKQSELLDCVYQNSLRLLDHVNHLIDFSLIQHKKIKPNPKKIHLNQFMNQIFNQYNHKILDNDKANVTLHLKKTFDDKDDYIISDDILLCKIVTLLMDNAIKYTEKGNIEMGYDPIGRRELIFYVKDTGIGIPKQQRKKIFNTFRQGSEGTTRKYCGLGLGLSLAKELVNLLGGNIGYRNNEPHGSLFYFTIPYKKALEGKNDKKNTLKYFKDKKILIADQNFDNYMHTRSILSQYPLEIIYLNEKEKIIDQCQSKGSKPDMIIINTEVNQNHFDNLIKDIKNINAGIPVIIQTKNRIDFNILRQKAGCDDYITRPFDTFTLIEKIAKHISKT